MPTRVFINDNYKSIRNYFPDERAKHLQIKSGHIAYFSSDGGERFKPFVVYHSYEYYCMGYKSIAALLLYHNYI